MREILFRGKRKDNGEWIEQIPGGQPKTGRWIDDNCSDGRQYKSESVCSNYDKSFIYTVGEEVSVPNFDENRWNECSTGIHFFITRQEAVQY